MLIPGDTHHHCDTSATAAVSRGHLIDEALARVQLTVGHYITSSTHQPTA